MITRYSWNNSPISQVDIGKNLSGNAQATIYVSANTNSEHVAALRAALTEHGMASYLDTVKGQNVLKVIGYGSEDKLLGLLGATKTIEGQATKEVLGEDGKQQSAWQKIREKGTNIAGALGMAGHAALIASGHIAHEKERVLAGLQYGTSAGILAVYGSGHEEKISKLCAGLREHLLNEGIPLTTSTHLTPTEAYRARGMLERAHDKFKANSILAANLIGVGGNISMLKSGIDVGKREGLMMGLGRAAHGGINLAGAGVASFVDEKDAEEIASDKEKSQRDDKKPGLFSGITDFIKRAPLAFQGGIFLVDNLATNYDAYKIRQRYFQRKSTDPIKLPAMPEGMVEGSKAHARWERKVFNKALQSAGHPQRLDINMARLTKALEDVPHGMNLLETIKTSSHSIPAADKCLEMIKTIDETVGKSGTVKALLADRKILLQELEEVQKYPKGWWLALAKAGLWTTSSAFQAIATKNRGISPEEKYSELAANVATMALDVPEQDRERMVLKSAEYLSSKDFVHIRADDLASRIRDKLTAISSGPWAATSPSTVEPAAVTAQPVESDMTKEVIADAAIPKTHVITAQHALQSSPTSLGQALA